MFLGLLFLLYKSNSFRGKSIPSGAGTNKLQHGHSHDTLQRENATLVMLVRYTRPPVTKELVLIGGEIES